MKAHYSGELANKRYPVVYDVTQGPLFEDLSFESRFEGGNLRRVVQRSSREYDLILNPDVNTSRHHFWFYFGVKNLTARVVYTFNIINLDRRDTVYTKRSTAGGLSPLLFSDGSWTRLSSLPGFSLSCYKNHYRYCNLLDMDPLWKTRIIANFLMLYDVSIIDHWISNSPITDWAATFNFILANSYQKQCSYCASVNRLMTILP